MTTNHGDQPTTDTAVLIRLRELELLTELLEDLDRLLHIPAVAAAVRRATTTQTKADPSYFLDILGFHVQDLQRLLAEQQHIDPSGPHLPNLPGG